MSDNVYCSKQKTTSKSYRENFDKIKWDNKKEKKQTRKGKKGI
jgi:hypothetical protein